MKRRSFLKGASMASLALSPVALASANVNSLNEPSGPFHYKRSLETARQMPGFLLDFIVTKEQTNGQYALIEGRAKKGAEPSKHVHEHEDEAFYMIDGEMIVTIGEEDYLVKPGDYIFLPRKIPHTQKILTDKIHVLLLISPAGFEDYFWNLSQPAKAFEVPPLSTEPPSEEMMKMFKQANDKFGISYLD